jgi:hypothetical protein
MCRRNHLLEPRARQCNFPLRAMQEFSFEPPPVTKRFASSPHTLSTGEARQRFSLAAMNPALESATHGVARRFARFEPTPGENLSGACHSSRPQGARKRNARLQLKME